MESETENAPSLLNRSYFQSISFFAKQFCLPKQIQLVDWQLNAKQGRELRDNIQIVDRIDLYDLNPLIRDIADAPLDAEFVDSGDGLISVARYLNIKVAICVTVYTQDKNMLKRTLEGVRKNYSSFYEKAGISAHQILVVVMFDGIQKLNCEKQSDKNMCSFFRQMDLINGFRKKEYLIAKEKQGSQSDNNNSDIIDIENFADQMIFTEKQYQELQQISFDTQYKEYMEMLYLLKFSEDLQKKRLSGLALPQLPQKMRKALVQRARMYLSNNGIQQITEDDFQLEQYIQQNLPQQKVQILKLQALKDCIQLAKGYLQSRQNTAIMYQSGLPLSSNDSSQMDAKMYLFCVLKHSNRGKLSSHLWFFEGFCNMINPEVCVLLDCGAVPSPQAVFKVWAHIKTFQESCGGVCGYMKLRTENPYDEAGNRPEAQSQSSLTQFCSYLVDIQKAQVFEYHFSHLLDKPFEGLTGYIHVLPGAFSGYNWNALKSKKFKLERSDGTVYQKQNEKRAKQQILKKYLKTVIYNEVLEDIKEANMFLAQDRVLCLQIYTRKQCSYQLQYLPDAECHVDPLTTLPKLLAQRKRWINGSWFALEYVLDNYTRVSESSHNCWHKLLFYFNILNSSITKTVSYIAVSLFFVTFHMMVSEFASTVLVNYFKQSFGLTQEQLVYAKVFRNFFSIRSIVSNFTVVIDFLFFIAMARLVFLSITLRRLDVSSKKSFNTISTWLGIFGLIFFALIVVNVGGAVIWNNGHSQLLKLDGSFTQKTFVYLLAVIAGAHIIVILSAFSLTTYADCIGSILSYLFYTPSYVNIFLTYAFCRIDDLSWGTKGLDNELKAKEKDIRRKFTDEKLKFLLTWLGVNLLVALLLTALANDFTIQNYLIWIFSGYFATIMAVKTIFVVLYHIQYRLYKQCRIISHIRQIKRGNQKNSTVQSNNFITFVKKVKEKQVDRHLDQINQDIVNKNIADQLFKSKRKRIGQLGMITEQDFEQSPIRTNPKIGSDSEIRSTPQKKSPLKMVRKSSMKQINSQQLISTPMKEVNRQGRISFRDLQRLSIQVGNSPIQNYRQQ